MPETSPAQGTLKRLIEAESQARDILGAAEAGAQETIAQAREHARQSIESVRQETASALESRLKEVDTKAAADMKLRLEQAESEARQIERRAEQNFPGAVDLVVDWLTRGGERI